MKRRKNRRHESARRARRKDAGGRGRSRLRTLEALSGLLAGGRFHEALFLCDEVLKGDPGDPDALNLSAIAYFELGFADRALSRLRIAIDAVPTFVDAHNNLGNVLQRVGSHAEAEAAYRAATRLDPDHVNAHFGLGGALEAQRRWEDARRAYARVLELAPDFLEARMNMGNALKALGRHRDALRAYERVLAMEPGHADTRCNLGSLFYELARMDEAEAALREALKLAPSHAQAWYNLGLVLQECRRVEEAIDAYRRAVALEPRNPSFHVNLGYAFHESRELEASEAAYARALAIDPANWQACTNLVDLLLDRGLASRAVDVCLKRLDAEGWSTGVVASLSLALNDCDELSSAPRWVDFDRFIEHVELERAGHRDVQALNRELASHVLSHPTLVDSPSRHATRSGRHSGELLVRSEGPVAELERIIRDEVTRYCERRIGGPPHPFMENVPAHFDLNAWGVVLSGGGHQIPHIHPSAWLSGVYYVRVPSVVRDAGTGRTGWIEFGRPPEHFHHQREFEVRGVEPAEGSMLLFPSYFFHRTIAGTDLPTRISIAFDVIPKRA